MKGLTQKQHEILAFIEKFIDKNGYSPSYREIMHHFSFSSTGSVYKHIRTLKRKGVLTAEKQCSRSLTLTHSNLSVKNKTEIQLPFIGHISVGYPIEMFVQSQTLDITACLVPTPEKTYVLRVQGDSLNDDCMNDGDLLLVEARQEAQAGETIIALINQHETIIKSYYPEGQYIRLEGRHHQPLILRHDSILIQGVIIGLLRMY